jgi:hypothetical protein
MKISAEWLAHGLNAAAEEAATVARIRIALGNKFATDMRAGQNSLINYVVAPAYPLAETIVYRWWTIIYGRGRTTNLRSMRAGFAIPDVAITSTGIGIEVKCEPFSYENPPVEFITKASEHVAIADFEGDMKCFIDDVTKRLENERISETPLSTRWSKVLDSANDMGERDFCRAAGAFGVDPYACGEDAAAFIETAFSFFEDDELEEFLSGVKQDSGSGALSWLRHAERQPEEWSIIPSIDDCRREISFHRTAGEPWQTGYVSARKVRRCLGFSDSEALGDLPVLALRLGNSKFRTMEKTDTGLRGISRIQPNKPRAIVAGSHNPRTSLFATARTFGDAIHFGTSRRSPVTDQLGTYRQQLGRAFAAEFLAPVKVVMDMYSAGEEIDDIASNFGVSDWVISHQIENYDNNVRAG